MAMSNRQAVENNRIPTSERLDLVAPRNGTLSLNVTIQNQDVDGNSVPFDLTGYGFSWSIKTSYQSARVAMMGEASNVDPENGTLTLSVDMSQAKGLGIDVIDCVHDFVIGPTGSTNPRRIFSGLLELSKGVGTGLIV